MPDDQTAAAHHVDHAHNILMRMRNERAHICEAWDHTSAEALVSIAYSLERIADTLEDIRGRIGGP